MKGIAAFVSFSKGFPGAVDSVKAEDQNEVPVEEHGFCLLDMDRGR
jgi:hypothetical protein